MKPLKNEIVKGTDESGNQFEQGRVVDSSATQSRIELPDGNCITARNDSICGQAEGAQTLW